MNLKIDKAGRLVVPKFIRERFGFNPDMELELIEQPGGILLRPAQQKPSMIKIDGLWVHHGSAQDGVDWNRIIDDVRNERASSFQPV